MNTIQLWYRFVFSLIILCIFNHNIAGQSRPYQFVHYSAINGLSHDQITCFYKDRQGFVWIGTAGGLNRFDGNNFRRFTYNPRDSVSISDNQINSIFEDPNGKLWINTRKGFSIYDPITETITAARNHHAKAFGLENTNFSRVISDNKQRYWIYHNTSGLVVYNNNLKSAKSITHIPFDSLSISPSAITDMAVDPQKGIWLVHSDGILELLDFDSLKIKRRYTQLKNQFGNNNPNIRLFLDTDNEPWIYVNRDAYGIYHLDIPNNRFRQANTKSDYLVLNNSIVTGMVSGPDRKIWVATDHGGLNIIDKLTRKVTYILHNAYEKNSLSESSLQTIYKDNEGLIWVGTYKSGLNLFQEAASGILSYKNIPGDSQSLSHNDVNHFIEDKHGNLWIGTNGGGLIYFNRQNNTFKSYRHDPKNPKSLSNDIIVSMASTRDDKLWIGTYYGGLNSFDGKDFTHYTHDPNNPESLPENRVWELLEDQSGNLWIGTVGAGLSIFNIKDKKFHHFKVEAPNSIHSDYVPALLEDNKGNIWIGTAAGIEIFNKTTGLFTQHTHKENDTTSLSSDNIICLAQDKAGIIWIGTTEGISIYNSSTQHYKNLDKRHGLPDLQITTLTVDDDNNLWAGTAKGLAKITINSRNQQGFPIKINVNTYGEQNGLQGYSFNQNAALKLKTGEMVFGGPNGFNIFEPNQLELSTKSYPVVLTDFQIFNKSVKPLEKINGNIVLNSSAALTKNVQLKYEQNVFTLEFSTLQYILPGKVRYFYRLIGFNDEWFEADPTSRKVTYTNLDPGEYTFQVKTIIHTNEDTPPGLNLNIKIAPPFWQTPLAYFFYFIAILGALILGRSIILERERMQSRLALERQEAQQLHNLDLMKIRFFTNISHEFRTPLTLILTPVESLLTKVKDSSQRNQLAMVLRNAERLLNLVNQLLDFKKLEVEDQIYHPTQGDIISFLQEIIKTFEQLSDEKKIKLQFNSPIEHYHTLFDHEKISRIMFNLLSNAFKFTPSHGEVSVTISPITENEQAILCIEVTDSGVGIPEEDQLKIFDRFYQHNPPTEVLNQGSGIGLSITREFVIMHGGEIKVNSTEGQGSTFTINLPLTPIDFQESTLNVKTEISDATPVLDENTFKDHTDSQLPKLVIVEDNDDFRRFMQNSFEDEFCVFTAENGQAGLKLILSQQPELIISDVMMPVMDGVELCKAIKNDPRISHIPVVLLTARSSADQQLQGYEAGADAYVSKPFHLSVLQQQIRNLMTRRKRMHQHFKEHIEIETSQFEITPLDEQFIRKAVHIVEEKMADPEFNVELLSDEMAISRVYLYKKISALTGKTPVEFIRLIRLNKAAQLLLKSQLSVSEIAYEVGFNNPKYFTKLFKEEFDCLPSEYSKRQNQN